MAGNFITFEGGEGTGKSTQIRLLYQYLKQKGKDVLATKEPGGTEIGAEIRRMLVCGDKDKLDAVAEALLYFVDRRVHLVQKIWPALDKGTWVLSDRFADSTFAYQCYGYDGRVSKEMLACLYQIAVGDFEPDLTIILDIDPKIGLARSFKKAEGMVNKETRIEKQGLAWHERLRHGFLKIAEDNSDRCVVLDANKSIDDLHNDIVGLVSQRFGL